VVAAVVTRTSHGALTRAKSCGQFYEELALVIRDHAAILRGHFRRLGDGTRQHVLVGSNLIHDARREGLGG